MVLFQLPLKIVEQTSMLLYLLLSEDAGDEKPLAHRSGQLESAIHDLH
jgi:hypothetical protein